MSVSWNNEYDPSQLAQRIEESKISSDDPQDVKFEGFVQVEYQALLYSVLKFPDSIPEIECRGMVQRAIFKAGAKGIITAKSLLAEVNRLANEYQKRPSERYVLVTSLSLKPISPLRRVRIEGATIVFEPILPLRYQKEVAKLIPRARHSLLAEPPTDYLFTRVHLPAKSVYEAANNALSILDMVRGIWNWFYNRGQHFRMSFGGKPSPVNKIVLGPVHTLHHPNGKLATESCWYEPHYSGAVRVRVPSREIDDLREFFSNVRKKLARCDYARHVKEAIIRYTRALDETDWNTAFLRLWGVLEYLTHTENNYKETIRRASFLFQDREYSRQVLRHLKDYRNSFVHYGADNSEIETYMYQLKGFVEALLSFHLGNRYGFPSLKDASTLLDLPSDRETLRSKIELMKYAQVFLHHV